MSSDTSMTGGNNGNENELRNRKKGQIVINKSTTSEVRLEHKGGKEDDSETELLETTKEEDEKVAKRDLPRLPPKTEVNSNPTTDDPQKKSPPPPPEDDERHHHQPYLYRGVAYDAAPDYDKSQFEPMGEKQVPWRSAALAIFLLFLGCGLLGVSIMRMFDSLDDFLDRVAPLILLGSMSFIPGAYHTWVFVCASLDVKGYSYDDIPQFN